jgi:hypothetical protein
MRLTTEQVQGQASRFDHFINTANLEKIGHRYFYFMGHDANDGRYNSYCYLLRVLQLIARVGGTFIHPNTTGTFYREILEKKSINAYLKKIEGLK